MNYIIAILLIFVPPVSVIASMTVKNKWLKVLLVFVALLITAYNFGVSYQYEGKAVLAIDDVEQYKLTKMAKNYMWMGIFNLLLMLPIFLPIFIFAWAREIAGGFRLPSPRPKNQNRRKP